MITTTWGVVLVPVGFDRDTGMILARRPDGVIHRYYRFELRASGGEAEIEEAIAALRGPADWAEPGEGRRP